MATYRAIASSETDANSPLTTTLMQALAENPAAIAEGADGAPKIAQHVQNGSGAAAGYEFEDMDDFGGVVIHFYGHNGAGDSDVQVALSDNDTTYATARTLVTVPASTGVSGTVFVNFADGTYNAAGIASTTAFSVSGTMTIPAGDVTAIRINGGSNLTIAAIALPNGGRSAT